MKIREPHFVALSALAMTLLLVAMLVGAAFARDAGGRYADLDPVKRQWLKSQKAPGTSVSCCDMADGEDVQERIEYDERGRGHYWIKGGHFEQWTLVRDEVVLKDPNLYGEPVAWVMFQGGKPVARCYAPGAKT